MTAALLCIAFLIALTGRLVAAPLRSTLRLRLIALAYAAAILGAIALSEVSPLGMHLSEATGSVLVAIAAGLVWRLPHRLATWTSDIGEGVVVLVAAVTVVVPAEHAASARGIALVLACAWALGGLATDSRERAPLRVRIGTSTATLGVLSAALVLALDLGALPPWSSAPAAAATVASTTAVAAVALQGPRVAPELPYRLAGALLGAAAGVSASMLIVGHDLAALPLPAVVGALLVDAARPPRIRGTAPAPQRIDRSDPEEGPDEVRQTRVVIERLTDPLAAQNEVVAALDGLFPRASFALLRSPSAPRGLLSGAVIDDELLGEVCRLGSLTREQLDQIPRSLARRFDTLGATLLVPVVCDDTTYGALMVQHDSPSDDRLVQIRRFADLLAYKLETHRLYSELERKERLATLGTFSAALAHDLRNPLGTVRLNLQMVERVTTNEADRLALADALEAVDRALGSLSGTLDFTRALALDVAELDLASLVERLVAGLRHDPRCRVSLRADEGLPAVRGDEARLVRVFENLLRNAMEAAPYGSEVAVDVGLSDEGVEVRITDRGPGIPPQDRDRIFEPFQTSKKEGVGLGLAIVKKIVERHRGHVVLEPGRGGGTCARVWLPMVTTPPTRSDRS